MLQVFVGFDTRELAAYAVCVRSLRQRATMPLATYPLVQAHLRGIGLYWRSEVKRGPQVWDAISEAPVSTEFAITRFLVPSMAEDDGGWALFCDADFLWRADVAELYALRDPSKAVMVVQHDHRPDETTKMDGQLQVGYARKNWSSLMLFNVAHPAHRRLSVQDINSLPGRDLHRFCWLEDDEIGALPVEWNWLEGWSDPSIDPKAVHFTRGTPDMPGHENAAYADEWRACAEGLTQAA